FIHWLSPCQTERMIISIVTSEWNITGFLEEGEVEPLELKIDRYLKRLQDIVKRETGLEERKFFLIDIEKQVVSRAIKPVLRLLGRLMFKVASRLYTDPVGAWATC
ncbi:14332_t:CDS:2, partial [Funneliformis caledonium]